MAPVEPLTLTPSGTREVVDAEKANKFITEWQEQLADFRSANPDQPILCNKIILSDKSYTPEAASIIANFLTSKDTAVTSTASNDTLAHGITIADLSDIIASRPEIEGLEVLETISNAFQQSKLTEVDLSDNALGSKGISKCQTIFSGMRVDSLESVSLCNNGLSEYSMDEIADVLTATSSGSNGTSSSCIAQNLTKIHFFNNMSGDKGCDSFAKIMQHCTEKLTDIRYSGTRAKSGGSKTIAKALKSLAAAGKLDNLTSLDLGDNSFGESYQDLADALSSCTKLVHLNLRDCILTDDGVVVVCKALEKAACPLVQLHLSGNEITAPGAKSVAKLLKTTIGGTIEHFDADENEMTSIGMKHIVNELSRCSSLKVITLNQNECGVIGGKALIGCASLPHLHRIELDFNMFPEDLVGELYDAFGDKLKEMEDNDEEEDADAELSEEEEEQQEQHDSGVDDLAGVMAKIHLER